MQYLVCMILPFDRKQPPPRPTQRSLVSRFTQKKTKRGDRLLFRFLLLPLILLCPFLYCLLSFVFQEFFHNVCRSNNVFLE